MKPKDSAGWAFAIAGASIAVLAMLGLLLGLTSRPIVSDFARPYEMVAALRSSGPHPSQRGEALLFDRFVGAWDFDCDLYVANGKAIHFRGEWIFGRVLGGHAIQDVWIGPAPDGRAENRRFGTTFRFYDPKAGLWHAIFIVPASAKVISLVGGAKGNRIVLEGRDVDGARLRWSFDNMKPDAFLWRGETSSNNGKTWRIEQIMRLKRRADCCQSKAPAIPKY